MKALSIIGIILAPIASFISLVFVFVIESFRYRMYFIHYSLDVDIVQRDMMKSIERSTALIGLVTLVLMFFFIVLYSISIKAINNNVVKVVGVIGITLSIFMICWDIVMMSSPLAISFDEIGFAWVGYFILCLGLSIVLLIQFNRIPQIRKVIVKENVLDDLEFE